VKLAEKDEGPKLISGDLNRSLSKVIYVTVACTLSYLCLISYGTHLLFKALGGEDLDRIKEATRLSLPFLYLSYIATVSLALLCFRSIVVSYFWAFIKSQRYLKFRIAFLGLLTGLGASLIASPLPTGGPHGGIGTAAVQIADIIDHGNSTLLMLLVNLALVLLIAVCTEVLFRGILFRALTEHATLPASLIASCLVCYMVWPIYNPLAGVLLGVASAVLFFRTRAIVSSVVANIVFTLAAPSCSVLFHSLVGGVR
jgi:membrane protease YdiL (CAAX protease family)